VDIDVETYPATAEQRDLLACRLDGDAGNVDTEIQAVGARTGYDAAKLRGDGLRVGPRDEFICVPAGLRRRRRVAAVDVDLALD
jgi:hypothetical protein